MTQVAIKFLILFTLLAALALSGCARPTTPTEVTAPASATVAPESPKSISDVYLHMNKAGEHQKHGQYFHALREYQIAQRSITPTDPPSVRGDLLNKLTKVLLLSGKHDEALKIGHAALQTNKLSRNQIEVAKAHLNLGEAKRVTGNLEEAQNHWEAARTIAHDLEHHALLNAVEGKPLSPEVQTYSDSIPTE